MSLYLILRFENVAQCFVSQQENDTPGTPANVCDLPMFQGKIHPHIYSSVVHYFLSGNCIIMRADLSLFDPVWKDHDYAVLVHGDMHQFEAF